MKTFKLSLFTLAIALLTISCGVTGSEQGTLVEEIKLENTKEATSSDRGVGKDCPPHEPYDCRK